MSEIIKKLENEIAISKVSADNENYLIKMSIKDGEAILSALREQPKPENERMTRAEQYALMQGEIDTLQADNEKLRDEIGEIRNQWHIDLNNKQAELDKLRGITHGDSSIVIIEGLETELAEAKERIGAIGKYAYKSHCDVDANEHACLYGISNMCEQVLKPEKGE